MNIQVLVIPVEGEVTVEEVPPDRGVGQLAAFQRLLGGGYLAPVRLREDAIGWVDEEGEGKLPINARASGLVAREGGGSPPGPIFGPMVIAGFINAETIDAPADVLAWAKSGVVPS